MQHREKYIDESWKESATQDKERLAQLAEQVSRRKPSHPQEVTEGSTNPAGTESTDNTMISKRSEGGREEGNKDRLSTDEENTETFEINFLNYVTSMGFQALCFLGEIPHPMTNMVETNIEQAKLLIDTLVMVREKTKGNLTRQEGDVLNTTIYELQVKYVELLQKEGRK